ncbi:MAG: hypothetical protein WCF81_18340 [Roseiarcus sp.]
MEQERGVILDGGKPEFVNEDLREALLTVAGRGGSINNRALGQWIASHRDRVLDGQRFEDRGTRQGVAIWALVKVEEI